MMNGDNMGPCCQVRPLEYLHFDSSTGIKQAVGAIPSTLCGFKSSWTPDVLLPFPAALEHRVALSSPGVPRYCAGFQVSSYPNIFVGGLDKVPPGILIQFVKL